MLPERISICSRDDVGTTQAHWSRYVFALQHCVGKRVLDAGCGVGYGSWLLSQVAEYVVGVDKSRCAINAAVGNFSASNIQYVEADWAHMGAPEPLGVFDIVIAFEFIEHLRFAQASLVQVREFIGDVKGLAIVSLPINQGTNPYHLVGDMTFQECVDMMLSVFPACHIFYQPLHDRGIGVSNVQITPGSLRSHGDSKCGQVIMVAEKGEE